MRENGLVDMIALERRLRPLVVGWAQRHGPTPCELDEAVVRVAYDWARSERGWLSPLAFAVSALRYLGYDVLEPLPPGVCLHARWREPSRIPTAGYVPLPEVARWD